MHVLFRAVTPVLLLFLLPASTGAQMQGPPQDLLDVYQLAREADPLLRRQHFELEVLREGRREDLARLLPQASIGGMVSRTRRDQTQSGVGGEEGVTRNFTMTRYGLNVSQALLNQPAQHRLRRGDSEVERGEAELEAVRQGLVARVAEAYLEVLNAQSGVELAQQEFRAIDANRDRVEGLYAERMAALADLEEVRARGDIAHAAVVRAEGNLDVALERLSEITDAPHARLAGLRPEAELPPPDPEDLDVWVEQALWQNPEIRALSQRVTSSDEEYRAARARRYPTVDLVAGYNYLDDLDGTVYGRVYDDLSVGVQLNMPLYAGGGIGAQSRGALNRRDRDREALEAARRSVRGNVRAAFRALQSGRSQIAALEQAVRSSERSLEAVDAGYRAALRPLVDLLDAQRDLFSTQRELTQARYEYLLNLLALHRAAGVLDEGDVVALNDMLAP
jgi:outer membrane protein